MKIAYIVESIGALSETFVSDLALGLAGSGRQVWLFVDQASTSEGDKGLCSEVPIGFASSGLKMRVWGDRLSKVFRKRDFNWGARLLLQSARRRFVPALARIRPDVAYIDFGTNAVLARRSLEELRIPYIVHFHGLDASSLLADRWYLQEVQGVFAGASAIVVASNFVRRRLILAGCDETKIFIIRLGIDFSRIIPSDWAEKKRGSPSVVHVGRLVEKKNPVALLHAFRIVRTEIPQAKLTIIGDGPLLSAARARAQRLAVQDCVEFLGALSHEEVLKEMSRHWVLAQHSVTGSNGDQEGFALSLTEAAASGLPIVATFHDGIPENVIDRQTGFLVPEYDYEAMAERILRFLRDPSLAEEMGAAGQKRAKDHFQSTRRLAEISALLSKVAQVRES